MTGLTGRWYHEKGKMFGAEGEGPLKVLNSVTALMSHHKRGGKFQGADSMADVERILAQLREEAAARGASWL